MGTSAIILAAGQGKRMGKEVNKLFLKVNKKPILAYSLEKFGKNPLIDEIVVVINKDDEDHYQEILEVYKFNKPVKSVYGGERRQDSSYEGVKASDESSCLILVHDGARPFFSQILAVKLILKAEEMGGAIPGIEIKDTIREKTEKELVGKTLNRERLYRIQTPQCFKRKTLLEALEKAIQEDKYFTDEAGVVQAMTKVRVVLIPGEEENIKITSPFDLKIAKLIATQLVK